jgi:hypothetical protein
MLLLISAIAHSLDLEYISPAQKEKLVEDFEHAKLEKADAILGKKWSCDMYGVRSRMQVQRDVKLYTLNKGTSGTFANTGAQVVSKYRFEKGVFAGQQGKFEDSLRMTAKGELISRLSVLQPQPAVIAYSVCKVL